MAPAVGEAEAFVPPREIASVPAKPKVCVVPELVMVIFVSLENVWVAPVKPLRLLIPPPPEGQEVRQSVRIQSEVFATRGPANVEVAFPFTASVPAKVNELDHWGAVPDEVRTVLAEPMPSLLNVVAPEAYKKSPAV